jgi:hypothetical protein
MKGKEIPSIGRRVDHLCDLKRSSGRRNDHNVNSSLAIGVLIIDFLYINVLMYVIFLIKICVSTHLLYCSCCKEKHVSCCWSGSKQENKVCVHVFFCD